MTEAKYLTRELVSRDTAYSFYKYIGMLPNPDRVLGRTGRSIEAYRDLKNDAHVWSCIQSRKSGLLALDYCILPNGASPGVVREIEKMLNRLDIQQLERDILEAPLFGYQPLELIWHKQEGFMAPASVSARPQEWFYFDADGNLNYRRRGSTQGDAVPPMKIINAAYEASYMNPYGDALLGKCYWPVTFKNGGLRFWVNFMERYGMPIMVGQYTRGASSDEVEKLAEALGGMTQDAVIVTPGDIDLKLHEAARTSSVGLYRDLIRHCNAEISKAILSQTLTTELDMGSYAASMTHFKIRREVIQSDIRLVESAMNRLIGYIVELNFAGSSTPQFHIVMNDSDNMQRFERDLKLAGSGLVRFTRDYWISTYGYREEDIE